MTDTAPSHAGNGAPPIDEAAVVLARGLVSVLHGQPAETALLALLLALADIIVDNTAPADDPRLVDLLRQQLTICVTRLRDLPPLE